MTMKLPLLAVAATLALQASAHALPATTTADLSLRIGPGPTYPLIAVIDRNAIVEVEGCVDRGLWCQVSWNGRTGWSYAPYLAHAVQGRLVALPEVRTQVQVPTVVYYEQRASVAPVPPTVGTLGTLAVPFDPVRATIEATSPPPAVATYVMTNRVEPVYLEGEPVVGAILPPNIVAHPVPQYQYGYTVVNGRVVLVEQGTNRIVYVYR